MSSAAPGTRFEKALFIVPPARVNKSNSTYYPPLGILYIAATLEANGIEADVFDASVDNPPNVRILDEIRRRRPQMIGLTCTTHSRFEMRDLVNDIKRDFPEVFVVVGGPHVTFCPEETLRYTAADAVVIGEGEIKTLALCQGAPMAQIPGLAWRNGAEIVVNPEKGFIEDLNTLPSPARYKVDMTRYPGYSTLKRRTTHILSNRGCPFGCLYCSATFFWGKSTRSLSAEKVLAEIDDLVETYGIRAVYFYDDAFTTDKKKARAVCEGLIERNHDLVWGTSTRIDLVDEETLELLARAGCRQVDFGLETLNPAAQKQVGTKATFERARRTIRMARKAGIKHVKVYLIIGLPGDDPRSMRETFAKTISMVVSEVSTQVLRIYPGTRLEILARERGMLNENFSWYDEFTDGWSMFESVPIYREWPQEILEAQYNFLSSYLRISGAVRQRLPLIFQPIVAKLDAALFRTITMFMKRFRNSSITATTDSPARPAQETADAGAGAACH